MRTFICRKCYKTLQNLSSTASLIRPINGNVFNFMITPAFPDCLTPVQLIRLYSCRALSFLVYFSATGENVLFLIVCDTMQANHKRETGESGDGQTWIPGVWTLTINGWRDTPKTWEHHKYSTSSPRGTVHKLHFRFHFQFFDHPP